MKVEYPENETIIRIDDHKPHLVVPGIRAVHVIPVEMIQNIISGKLPLADCEDLDDYMQTILKEWLESRPWYPNLEE